MSLQNPAHVGHGITHSSAMGTLLMGAAGVVAGVVIVCFGWELAVGATVWEIGAAILGGGSMISTTGSAGMLIGKYSGSNKLFAAGVAGHLLTGFPTVLLGPQLRDAARADEDTTADCAGPHVGWEGSNTVSLGSKPMSRVGDRLKCQGKIGEGLDSVHVGGIPSHSQDVAALAEASSSAEYWLSVTLDVLGIAGATTWPFRVMEGTVLAFDASSSPYSDAVDATSTGISVHMYLKVLRFR